MNSVNYQILRALEEVQKFGDVESLMIFIGEYIGLMANRAANGFAL